MCIYFHSTPVTLLPAPPVLCPPPWPCSSQDKYHQKNRNQFFAQGSISFPPIIPLYEVYIHKEDLRPLCKIMSLRRDLPKNNTIMKILQHTTKNDRINTPPAVIILPSEGSIKVNKYVFINIYTYSALILTSFVFAVLPEGNCPSGRHNLSFPKVIVLPEGRAARPPRCPWRSLPTKLHPPIRP